MKALWQEYSAKFQQITLREQGLIALTGAIAIVFILYHFFIDENSMRSERFTTDIKQIEADINNKQQTISIFEQALAKDPNENVNKQIAQYENQLGEIDVKLLALTSDLIDPIQMRFALIELLTLQKGVSLQLFEAIPAQPISLNSNTEKVTEVADNNSLLVASDNQYIQPALMLYKHGIKLTLTGDYFQLRDYLSQLEQLKWTFFWHKFDYNLAQYPKGKLEVELYSLSTKKEFIGV